MSEERKLQCIQCQEWFGESFFHLRVKEGMYTFPRRKLRCKHCEQINRDGIKLPNRWLVKARTTYGHHARKFMQSGVIKAVGELRERFGWDIERIAHEMEHAFGNGCKGCEESYASFPNGLRSIELDIFDPKLPPYYRGNTQFLCQTCNREKSDMSPIEWAIHLLNWKRAKAAYARFKLNPFADTLLEDLGPEGWIKI